MALQLNKMIKEVTCNYWIITKVVSQKFSSETHVTLSLFVSKETRDMGGIDNEITFTTFVFEGIDYSLGELYTKIKTQSEFVDAVDC